jgi:DNA-binding CsgD family transcriptional regulator
VAADRRELAAARDSAAEAVAALREIDAPFDLARALLLAGSLARRMNRRADARELLAEARSISERIGAAPSAEQARRELDRLGIRAGDPTQLTATEAEIARLVATGRSNGEIATQLFVSRRTVESNLTRVYRKLGVRTRVELAARLAADGS